MIKLLVLSDSHGRSGKVKQMIAAHKDADGIIYLGDGEKDLESALAANGFVSGAGETFKSEEREIFLYQVRGNCDRISIKAVTLIREIGGWHFYITHGFEQRVKYGLEQLAALAKEAGCSIALFGHTHGAHCSEKNGVTLFNPGSAANGSYGVITIDREDVRFQHCTL